LNKRIALVLISSLIVTASANAEYSYMETSDFTGEAFFLPPSITREDTATNSVVRDDEDQGSTHTAPPFKNLRMKIQERAKYRDAINSELAPTAKDLYESETVENNTDVSEYASQDEEEKFEDNTFENEMDLEVENNEKKEKKSFFKKNKNKENAKENTEEIILDCENIDYDTNKYLVYATGNVSVHFVKQKATVKADIITFDRINNTVKAEGNVKILKSGQEITGEYIFLDLNEENALIEAPQANTANLEIKSQKGYVYSDRIIQENGTISVNDSFPVNFKSAGRGPRMSTMLVPKNQTLTENMENGLIKIKVQDLKITQRGEHETLEMKKLKVFKGGKTVLKLPSVKLYTNKNHDFVENAGWEVGSYRGLGMYAGPGFVFELPKGSVLRASPILNYKSGVGIGAIGRFSSGTNRTLAAYGTARDKVIVYGKQDLDDNLFLQYGVNGYMDEWFMGRRRPKYGVSLVYNKSYGTNNFLLKDHRASFKHRLEGGYFHDLDFDGHFEKLKGTEMGTSRFRYMAQGTQNLYEKVDKENLKAFRLDLISQVSTALYGTGHTQAVARIAPNVHFQYKRWMQDIGYYFSAYDDNTPIPVFDAYRYGKQALYLREYFRINKYLTLFWYGNINMSNDSVNGRTFQGNAFYLSIGPDDVKFNIGYDFIRQNMYCSMELMMDAKGANLEYDTFEIKQDKKAEKAPSKKKDTSFEYAPTQTQILERAVVEDIKVMEDVL